VILLIKAGVTLVVNLAEVSIPAKYFEATSLLREISAVKSPIGSFPKLNYIEKLYDVVMI